MCAFFLPQCGGGGMSGSPRAGSCGESECRKRFKALPFEHAGAGEGEKGRLMVEVRKLRVEPQNGAMTAADLRDICTGVSCPSVSICVRRGLRGRAPLGAALRCVWAVPIPPVGLTVSRCRVRIAPSRCTVSRALCPQRGLHGCWVRLLCCAGVGEAGGLFGAPAAVIGVDWGGRTNACPEELSLCAGCSH